MTNDLYDNHPVIKANSFIFSNGFFLLLCVFPFILLHPFLLIFPFHCCARLLLYRSLSLVSKNVFLLLKTNIDKNISDVFDKLQLVRPEKEK